MLNTFSHKNLRLASKEYLGTKAFFITICAANRSTVFVDSELAFWILRLLRKSAEQYAFEIHAYCLMPDHLHFLSQRTQSTAIYLGS